MSEVNYLSATCTYPGAARPSVQDLSLDIEDGEFVVLVGPSGSGKSTALRMLAGLEAVTEGAIAIGGRDVSKLPPKDRDIAMVFQNYALYPHMSVAENMGFALKLNGVGKQERAQKVLEAARLLDLEQYLERKPKALSGGQRQRVAMGRAIVRHPSVFLMDEPLSNLDAKLRVETRANIAALQARLGTTTIYVTHDQVEAMTMGSRVAVLKDGVLQQFDTPRNLYDHPVNAFVAGFVGSPAMNLQVCPFDGRTADLGGTSVLLAADAAAAVRTAGLTEINLGVRPECLTLAAPTADAANGITLEVLLVEDLGAECFVHARPTASPDAKRVTIRASGNLKLAPGDVVEAWVTPGSALAFDPVSGARLC
ncbi:ABC transporter ATP-binding protein [Nocardioides ultimimeridianus]